jgi:BMFP domain-containing protein YqiC
MTGEGAGAGGGSGGGKRGKGLFDDLAGMAGGAFSVMSAVRAEAMAKAQGEAMVQRLDLVKREDLDAALEVARRAREQAETLAHRLAELEARVAALETREEPVAGPDDAP